MNIFTRPFQFILGNKTVRNSGLFAIFSFFNRGVSFVLITILARYISPADYGELSLFNTLIMLLGYFVGLSTAGYLSVSYFKENKKKFKEDFSTICSITLLVSVLILVLFVFSCNWLSGLLKISSKLLFVGLFISFANVFVGLNLDYYRVQEKLSYYGLLSCSFAILNFAITIYLVVFKGLNWHGQIYSLFVCNLIFFVLAIVIFANNKLFVIPTHKEEFKKIIIWGLPIIPHLASGWMKQGLDRYIIVSSHSMEDVGLFSFAMTLASVIIMVGTAFNQTNSVNIYQTLSSKESNSIKMRILKRKESYFSLVYLVVVIIIMVCGALAIPVLMPQYTSCIPYFLILSCYGFFQCVYFIYCNYLFYYNYTKQLMYITFGSSLIHFFLSLWLTRYSLYLTCFIYVVSMLIVASLVYLQSRSLLKDKLQQNK